MAWDSGLPAVGLGITYPSICFHNIPSAEKANSALMALLDSVLMALSDSALMTHPEWTKLSSAPTPCSKGAEGGAYKGGGSSLPLLFLHDKNLSQDL